MKILTDSGISKIFSIIKNALTGKQDSLNQEQLDAVNSGITSGKISQNAGDGNPLLSKSEVEELVQTLSLSPIVADNLGVKPFEFESEMYATEVPGTHTNLEKGPWFKNDGYGFIECGSGSAPIYVSVNDSAVVMNDESMFYYYANGYKYQREKTGQKGDWGRIKTPGGLTHPLTYSFDHPISSGKFETDLQDPSTFVVYFYEDDSPVYTTNRVIFVAQITNLVTKVDAIEEYVVGVNETIEDITQGSTPNATYDLTYPTTKYICTQEQTDESDPVWTYLYTVNETSFSSSQIDALNSTITLSKVNQIATNESDISAIKDGTNIDSFGDVESEFAGLAGVATSGSYNDLSDTPENVSEFENDAHYIVGKFIEDELDEQWKNTYRQVYYIESTKNGSTYGKQYIDLGFRPKRDSANSFDNTGFYIDFMPYEGTVNSNSKFFFSSGAPKDNTSNSRLHFNSFKSAPTSTPSNNAGEIKIGGFTPTTSTQTNFEPGVTANVRNQIEYKQGILTNYNTGLSTSDITSSLNDFESQENLLLFCANGSGQTHGGTKDNFAYFRLFQFKVYDNITGDTLMNLIPVVRINDNKPGLIDNLTGDFYYNQGTSGTDFNYSPTGDGKSFTLSNIYKDVDYALKTDIKNGTLTIQKNGSTIDTFTANSSSNKTVNITVPTSVTELTDGANYVQTTDFTADTTDWDYIMGNSNSNN